MNLCSLDSLLGLTVVSEYLRKIPPHSTFHRFVFIYFLEMWRAKAEIGDITLIGPRAPTPINLTRGHCVLEDIKYSGSGEVGSFTAKRAQSVVTLDFYIGTYMNL